MIISVQILCPDMTSAARKLEAEFNVEERTTRLEERVGFILADIAEMKADHRRFDAKLDATRDDIARVRESVSNVRESVAGVRIEMKDGFVAVDRRMADFVTKADLVATKSDLAEKIKEQGEALGLRIEDTHRKIEETKTHLTEKIDVAFDRRFYRSTGITVGAASALLGAFSYMQGMALTKSEIAVVAIGITIIIWSVSLFVTGRQPRPGQRRD